MRGWAGGAASLLLMACVPAPDPGRLGPTLIIDVRNASARQLSVVYQFTSEQSAGNGEAAVAACERHPLSVGEIGSGGTYSIGVDGKTVVEGSVPASAPVGASVVVNVLIGPDGDVEVLPPAIAELPPVDIEPIPCG